MVDQDFDHITNQYDQDFSNSLIGQAQRKLVWNVLDLLYDQYKNLNVLEVNCGTGVDAELFSQKGAKVLATDISTEMVKVASRRLSIYPNAQSQMLGFHEVGMFNEKFDLIFSNFGGLNCLKSDELAHFVKSASKMIHSGGHLIMVIMPKNTIWEMLYFSSKFSPKKAVRRMKKSGVDANVDGKKVKTYYHNPSFFEQFKQFSINSISPIGLYVPPSYMEPRYLKRPEKIEKFYSMDLAKLGSQKTAKFADHFCIVLEKK